MCLQGLLDVWLCQILGTLKEKIFHRWGNTRIVKCTIRKVPISTQVSTCEGISRLLLHKAFFVDCVSSLNDNRIILLLNQNTNWLSEFYSGDLLGIKLFAFLKAAFDTCLYVGLLNLG